MLKPSDIVIMEGGFLIGIFGKAEVEHAAALIIRWHHVNSPDEWKSVCTREIAYLFLSDPKVIEWGFNPFWQPDPQMFFEYGLIDGWRHMDPLSKGTLTEKFHEGLERYARRVS